MSTAPKPGGYIFRQEITRARQANNKARDCVRRILDEHPGPALAAMYLASAGVAFGEISDALHHLEDIGKSLCDQ